MNSPNPLDAELGARIRRRRLALRMSQREVGVALHISSQQFQKYENGTNRISSSRLQQLADVLDVEAAYFLEDLRSVEGGARQGRSEGGETIESLKLYRAFAAVQNEKVRKTIIDLVVSLAAALE